MPIRISGLHQFESQTLRFRTPGAEPGANARDDTNIIPAARKVRSVHGGLTLSRHIPPPAIANLRRVQR